MQDDQPGRAVRHLPGQPGSGRGHHRGGPANGDRQLGQRPPEASSHLLRAPDQVIYNSGEEIYDRLLNDNFKELYYDLHAKQRAEREEHS